MTQPIHAYRATLTCTKGCTHHVGLGGGLVPRFHCRSCAGAVLIYQAACIACGAEGPTDEESAALEQQHHEGAHRHMARLHGDQRCLTAGCAGVATYVIEPVHGVYEARVLMGEAQRS